MQQQQKLWPLGQHVTDAHHLQAVIVPMDYLSMGNGANINISARF